MLSREDLHAEMEKIRSQDPNGRLRPEDIVNSAMSKTSRLHSFFEWDDGEAADLYRQTQARQLIRVTVTVIPGSDEKFRAYCSLKQDRRETGENGGGYRSTAEVMSNKAFRAMLLQDAMDELHAFEIKFRKLTQLGPVFDAYAKLLAKAGKKTKKKTKKKARRVSRSSAGSKRNTRKPARAGRK